MRNTASPAQADEDPRLEKDLEKRRLPSLVEGLSKAHAHPFRALFPNIWILITKIKTACGVSINSILICSSSGG